MIEHLRLSLEAFREIGMEATGLEGLAVLDATHRNRQYLLLRMVVDRLPTGARAGGGIADALDLLTQMHREHRPAFDAVLTYPHVGAGLVRCLRELSVNADPRSAGRYLATIAAAAAFRAGVDFDIGTSVNAALHIPATGTAYVGASLPEMRLRQRDDHQTVGPVAVPRQQGADSPAWSAVRTIDTGIGAAVVLDDLDPDRGAGGLFPAGRLPSTEYTIWQDLFSLAGARLTTSHPDWARQIRHVMRAVTPLARQRPSQGRSASTWQAYGAVALTLPSDDRALAATLIHEAQHSKLNALMTIIDLYDREDKSQHYSPWRADPRPLRGLLHGCYAFLGVAAFWSAERVGDAGRRADYEFARAELQVRQGLDTLAGVQGLTEEGRDFVTCMAERLSALATSPVPDPVRHLAELAVDDHRLTWRLRSVVPNPQEVSNIADSWRARRPVTQLPVTTSLAGSMETFVPNDRIRLWTRLARLPVPASDEPDLLLAQHAIEAAAQGYLNTIRQDPESTAAWAGLAMAAARMNGPGRLLWQSRPELVRAVYRALHFSGGKPPDPLALARWLATG